MARLVAMQMTAAVAIFHCCNRVAVRMEVPYAGIVPVYVKVNALAGKATQNVGTERYEHDTNGHF